MRTVAGPKLANVRLFEDIKDLMIFLTLLNARRNSVSN